MTPALHYWPERGNLFALGAYYPLPGWYVVDDDYPLHIYPILDGPFETQAEAQRAKGRLTNKREA